MLEELAALEHEQWMAWSKSLVETEDVSQLRVYRWKKLWVPYSELSEEMKEEDRKWARKVMAIREKKLKIVEEIDYNAHNG